MNMPQNAFRGILLMLCAVLVFALMDCTSKWLVTKYPMPMLVWARYLGHCLLMLLLFLPSHGRQLWHTTRPRLQIVRALLLFGITCLMVASFQWISLTVATAIVFITPLLVGLLAGPMLGENTTPTQATAIVAGLAGMLLIARPGGEVAFVGAALAAAAATCNTAYQLLTRHLAPNERSITMLFYTALVGAVCSTALLPWFWHDIAPPPLDIFLIGMLSVLGACGHYLLIRAFRCATAATLAPFLYAQLIWAGCLDFVIFGHVPDGPTWLGVALIVGAGLSVAIRERFNARSRPSPPSDKAY